jgi:ubiquinone/menaquinone biosynthesis C-methylase UbiE
MDTTVVRPVGREYWAGFDPGEDGSKYGVTWVRDQLLARAEMGDGDRVLDVGAGPGLLAVEAARRLGVAGRVVALDLSHGTLLTCRQRASALPGAAPLAAVQGEALRLPFADRSFDAVLTRSVLMYTGDLGGAARECFRVLRPGGRVSLDEPITRRCRYWRWDRSLDMTPFQPEHDRLLAYARERDPYRAAVEGFDEHALQRAFQAAGFARVKLTALENWQRATRKPAQPASAYFTRSMGFAGLTWDRGLTYADAARHVLGAAAEAYLERLGGCTVDRPQETIFVGAYLVAWRDDPA